MAATQGNAAPSPETQKRVTDAQVEAALITWFKNEISWDKGMAPWSADQFRTEMRTTLEAALATDGQP
jgi:hypothetical protein